MDLLVKICHWLLFMSIYQSLPAVCASLKESGQLEPLPSHATNLFHVLRYARTREVSSPRAMPSHVVEEMHLIPDEKENGHNQLSFTIISGLKSLVGAFGSRRNAESAGSAYRRQEIGDQRRLEPTVFSRKIDQVPSSSTPPRGYYTLSKGVVKFIPTPVLVSTSRPTSYYVQKRDKETGVVKSSHLKPILSSMRSAALALNENIQKRLPTAAARRNDANSMVAKESKYRDGFFTVKNGLVKFHPLAFNRAIEVDAPISSGIRRQTEPGRGTLSDGIEEPRQKLSEITSNITANTPMDSVSRFKMGAPLTPVSATGRLPSFRIDDETLFVPSTPSLDGKILFNRMSVGDYLDQQKSNSTLQEVDTDTKYGSSSNTLLAQMEALYPGFTEIIKDKSQIVIQNVFLTPLMDKMQQEEVLADMKLKNVGRDRFPAVLTDTNNVYVPTGTFVNGTVVFDRYNLENVKDFGRHSIGMNQIEKYYPGFAEVAARNPPQIIIHTSILTVSRPDASTLSNGQLLKERFSSSISLPVVRIDETTIFAPTSSFPNGTVFYSRHEVDKTWSPANDSAPLFSLDQIQVFYPGFGDIVNSRPQPDHVVINNVFSVSKRGYTTTTIEAPTASVQSKVITDSVPIPTVTTSSTDVAEEQVRSPGIMKISPLLFPFRPKPSFYFWQRTPTTTTVLPTAMPTTTTALPTTKPTTTPTSTTTITAPEAKDMMATVMSHSIEESVRDRVDDLVVQLLDPKPASLSPVTNAEQVTTFSTVVATQSNDDVNSSRYTETPSIHSDRPTATHINLDTSQSFLVSTNPTETKESTELTALSVYENEERTLMAISDQLMSAAEPLIVPTTSDKPSASSQKWNSVQRPSVEKISPKPSVVSLINTSSPNFTSMVLAHTAALMAGKPSPFSKVPQHVTHETVVTTDAHNPATESFNDRLSVNSIVMGLTVHEKNDSRPETELVTSNSLGSSALDDQILYMAQSLMDGGTSALELNRPDASIGQKKPENITSSFSNGTVDGSESAIENPVNQLMVTTTINEIHLRNETNLNGEYVSTPDERNSPVIVTISSLKEQQHEGNHVESQLPSHVISALPLYVLNEVANESDLQITSPSETVISINTEPLHTTTNSELSGASVTPALSSNLASLNYSTELANVQVTTTDNPHQTDLANISSNISNEAGTETTDLTHESINYNTTVGETENHHSTVDILPFAKDDKGVSTFSPFTSNEMSSIKESPNIITTEAFHISSVRENDNDLSTSDPVQLTTKLNFPFTETTLLPSTSVSVHSSIINEGNQMSSVSTLPTTSEIIISNVETTIPFGLFTAENGKTSTPSGFTALETSYATITDVPLATDSNGITKENDFVLLAIDSLHFSTEKKGSHAEASLLKSEIGSSLTSPAIDAENHPTTVSILPTLIEMTTSDEKTTIPSTVGYFTTEDAKTSTPGASTGLQTSFTTVTDSPSTVDSVQMWSGVFHSESSNLSSTSVSYDTKIVTGDEHLSTTVTVLPFTTEEAIISSAVIHDASVMNDATYTPNPFTSHETSHSVVTDISVATDSIQMIGMEENDGNLSTTYPTQLVTYLKDIYDESTLSPPGNAHSSSAVTGVIENNHSSEIVLPISEGMTFLNTEVSVSFEMTSMKDDGTNLPSIEPGQFTTETKYHSTESTLLLPSSAFVSVSPITNEMTMSSQASTIPSNVDYSTVEDGNRSTLSASTSHEISHTTVTDISLPTDATQMMTVGENAGNLSTLTPVHSVTEPKGRNPEISTDSPSGNNHLHATPATDDEMVSHTTGVWFETGSSRNKVAVIPSQGVPLDLATVEEDEKMWSAINSLQLSLVQEAPFVETASSAFQTDSPPVTAGGNDHSTSSATVGFSDLTTANGFYIVTTHSPVGPDIFDPSGELNSLVTDVSELVSDSIVLQKENVTSLDSVPLSTVSVEVKKGNISVADALQLSKEPEESQVETTHSPMKNASTDTVSMENINYSTLPVANPLDLSYPGHGIYSDHSTENGDAVGTTDGNTDVYELNDVQTTEASTLATTQHQSPLTEPSTFDIVNVVQPLPTATKPQQSSLPDLEIAPAPSTHSNCGGETFERESMFTNPSYPKPDLDQGQCVFRVKIRSRNVCQLRVQFNESRMLLPREGYCVDQYLSVSGSITIPGVEKFCGINSDQHFYLDLIEPEWMDPSPRSVDFLIDTKARGFFYRYAISIHQIDCSYLSNERRAPRGCFQYYPISNGIIKSFNYDGGEYYNNVNYRICLRSTDETCAVAIAAPEGHFGLHKANSKKVPRNRSGVGSKSCVRDYLFIPVQSMTGRAQTITEDRYCGAKLSPFHGDKQPRVIIAPKYSSIYSVEFRTGTPRKFLANNRGPGFRLSFAHIHHCTQANVSNWSSSRIDLPGNDVPDELHSTIEKIVSVLVSDTDTGGDHDLPEDFYDIEKESLDDPVPSKEPAGTLAHDN